MRTSPKQDYAREQAIAASEQRQTTPKLNKMESQEKEEPQVVDNINKFIAGSVAAASAIAIPAYLAYNKYVNSNQEEKRKETLTEIIQQVDEQGYADKVTNPIISEDYVTNNKIIKDKAFKPESYKDRSNINEEILTESKLAAKLIEKVYDNTRKYGSGNFYNHFNLNKARDNFVLDEEEFEGFEVYSTESSLSQIFVDNENKKVMIAMRGIEIVRDIRDQFEILEMGATSLLPQRILDKLYRNDDNKIFGKFFNEDLAHIVDVIEMSKIFFENHEISLYGHSRAGGAVLEAGRAYNMKTIAFNPASNSRENVRDYTKHDPENIHIFMSEFDVVPKFIRDQIGYTPENTYLVKHTNSNAFNLYAHGINNFLDDHNIHSITKSERPQDKKQDIPISSIERQLAIGAPKTQLQLGAPKTQLQIGAPKTQLQIEAPKTQLQIGAPKTQLQIGAPKTKFNTDGLFAGYDFETQELFSSTPNTVFNDLNRIEPEEFKPIRLSVFDSIDENKDNIITLKEFTSYYKKFGNTDENIKETFNKLDINNDNVLSRNEI